MRARRPDFLAVDDPVVALLFGAGAQPGQIGAAGGFGKQLAPDVFAGCELRQIMLLMRLATPRHHRRAAHALADLEGLRQLAVDAFFLLPDHPLDRRRAAAAIFLGPVQAGPAGLRLLLLPGLADLDDVFLSEPDAAERGLRQLGLILLWRIGLDPLAGLGAERGFLRGVVEIHFIPPSISFPGRSAARRSSPRGALQSRGRNETQRLVRSRLCAAALRMPQRVRETLSSVGRYPVERHVLIDPYIARQAEHALGDYVAHDLVGAALDPGAG